MSQSQYCGWSILLFLCPLTFYLFHYYNLLFFLLTKYEIRKYFSETPPILGQFLSLIYEGHFFAILKGRLYKCIHINIWRPHWFHASFCPYILRGFFSIPPGIIALIFVLSIWNLHSAGEKWRKNEKNRTSLKVLQWAPPTFAV